MRILPFHAVRYLSLAQTESVNESATLLSLVPGFVARLLSVGERPLSEKGMPCRNSGHNRLLSDELRHTHHEAIAQGTDTVMVRLRHLACCNGFIRSVSEGRI